MRERYDGNCSVNRFILTAINTPKAELPHTIHIPNLITLVYGLWGVETSVCASHRGKYDYVLHSTGYENEFNEIIIHTVAASRGIYAYNTHTYTLALVMLQVASTASTHVCVCVCICRIN